MLIKPFGPLLNTRKKTADMSYLGTVEDNNDPDKLGKVKVRISPYTDMTTEELPWAYPTLGAHGNSSNSGGINVPELGSQVRVYFPSKDLTAPYYMGAELNKMNRVTLFDEDYPHTYGYKDSNGNFYKVNKNTGIAHFQHESTTNAQVSADGTIKVTCRGGAYFTLSSYNNFTLDIGGLEINGNVDGSLEVKSESTLYLQGTEATISVNKLNVTGDLSVGTGASGVLWLNNGIAIVENGIIKTIKNN